MVGRRDTERPGDNGKETKECEEAAGLQPTARQAVLLTDGSQDKKCTKGDGHGAVLMRDSTWVQVTISPSVVVSRFGAWGHLLRLLFQKAFDSGHV